ncbi:MAG: RES domain-containing protein [Arenimonas sp.]|nr:RES domain-containing protein [Arenimonas sp.]
MILKRIGASTRLYKADDISGAGAARFPGRWNSSGEFVLYAAPSLAMAVLETAAHVDDRGLPQNRYVVDIEIDDAVWRRRESWPAATLPVGWDAIPAGMDSIELGSAWYREGRSALLEVPSVIAPEETVLVINTRHPDAAGLKARKHRRFDYNALFRAG